MGDARRQAAGPPDRARADLAALLNDTARPGPADTKRENSLLAPSLFPRKKNRRGTGSPVMTGEAGQPGAVTSRKAREKGASKTRASKTGARKVGARKVGANEVRPGKTRAGKTGTGKTGSSKKEDNKTENNKTGVKTGGMGVAGATRAGRGPA